MGRKVIGIGAPTSTGGSVLEGNVGINIDYAVSTSSIGHIASCPVCPPGKGPIVAVGPRTVTLPAGPVALEGDYVACGCPPKSNTVLSGQSSVFGGGEHSAASFSAIIPLIPKPKSIQRITLSYGESQIPVDSVSRFYTDLNIHVKTSGYSPGEIVSVTITGAAEKTLSGTVGAKGIAIIPNAFQGEVFDMEGEV
ncbi:MULTISPECIES: PAAR domain-containing protein [unclassified Pseudomonas]|uniref:PAAR domain-containing protein n=1 Tax=unclassified Pseudomonas TaxID=196821 RepID=UPI0030D76B60